MSPNRTQTPGRRGTPRPPTGADRRGRAAWFGYAKSASVGLEMGLSVMVGLAAGMYLERNVTHVAPYTSLAGLFVGLGAAVNAVVRAVRGFKADLAAQAASTLADDGADEPPTNEPPSTERTDRGAPPP